ncbi:V-type proton ATPase subunit S1 isoform X1 [Anguilla anguilla]|uniref:V-type proton ATPase subunit S1 isoform X1 n=1 Tax=Anguilla anguilla TaxID=7936 RepID=UPI0015AE5B05|nr:V-type proton ATPase subunit S1 isoform X1 [Anguilla anguilla]
MADAKMNRVRVTAYTCAVLCCLFLTGCCSDQVPLIMWSSGGVPLGSVAPPAVGHVVSSSQLVSYLNDALSGAPHNVLLFLQEKLSLDDFTMYGGVFGNKQDSAYQNLESALQSSPPPSSLVLPMVSWPGVSAVPGLLQEQLGTSPLYLEPATLAQLRLNASAPALLIIRLPYSPGADMMSPKEVLSGNDEVIGQVLDIVKEQGVPYTAIYTALKPSRVIGEEISPELRSVGRSLLQVSPSTPYPPVEFKSEGSSCILLWAENLTISFYNKDRSAWERHDLTPQTFGHSVTPSLTGSSCNRSLSRLVLNYENVLGFGSFRLIFAMSRRFYRVSAREWFALDQVELEYDGQKATFNGSRNINAPAEFSYHCESVTSFRYALLVPRTASDNANQWRLSFNHFQIQGFGVMGQDFSYASDCAGFFTPGIWMGLLTSLLMVLILTYGLHMITQLRTMDRFDDPKGPAISVPQNE